MKRNKILIVDDTKLYRQSLSDILKQKYGILEAENGKIALDLLKQNRDSIVAVILDIVMPVMDGFEFMEEFNTHKEYKYIPVIVATTRDDVEVEKRCLALGVWDLIP